MPATGHDAYLADEPEAAWRELLVVDVVARDGVGVHEVGAALAGRGRALGRVGVVLAAPVVPELVGGHQVGLAGDDPAVHVCEIPNQGSKLQGSAVSDDTDLSSIFISS